MAATLHQLILPTDVCYHHHSIEHRPKQPGPGHYNYCTTCTLAYEMAMTALNDPTAADQFVQDLRRNP